MEFKDMHKSSQIRYSKVWDNEFDLDKAIWEEAQKDFLQTIVDNFDEWDEVYIFAKNILNDIKNGS